MTRTILSSRRNRLAALFALVLLPALGGVTSVNPAQADTTGPGTIPNAAYPGINYSSDPELFQCPNGQGGMTLCMYASHDIGSGASSTNYFPMEGTYLYRDIVNRDPSQSVNWFPVKVMDENTLCSSSGTVCGAQHQWAPGARYANGRYVLYVPDLTDTSPAGQHTSAVVSVFTSNAASGGSGYSFAGVIRGVPSIHGGYASDPSFFADTDGTNYLVTANGDGHNCGYLSIGAFSPGSVATLGWEVGLKVQGFGDNLGACSGGIGVPYLEGPSMYRSTDIGGPSTAPKYTLIFAAKPANGQPSPCAVQGGTSNEVIAYAQSDSTTGPFTYKGILMCPSKGSDGGESTNQASAAKDPATGRVIFAYHDGPFHNGTSALSPKRTVHLQCLKWLGTAIPLIPRSGTNLSNC